MSEDDPFADLVPQRLAFPVNAPSQPAPGFAPVPPQSAAPVADDLSFDDLIPTQPMPNVWDAVKAGVSSSIHGLGQTAETMRGGKPVAEDANPAAAPLAWSDLASPGSQLAPKIAYRLAEGAPAMAGGITGAIGGGLAGSAVAPGVGTVAGSLAGGTLGTAAVSAAQTLGPYFAQALKESPDKPEEAYTKALHAAELAGVFGGASWALFPVRAFQGPVKQMMFQAFGVQPAVAVAHKASSNVVEGKPVTEDLGQSYAEGATMTALPMAGHALATKALGAVTRPGIRVPSLEERVEPVFDSVGSREVQPVADVGAVIEPAEPVVVKKKRTRSVDQAAADKFAKKAADLTVETQAGPVEPVMAPEVIPPASGPVPFDYASVPRSSDKIAALRAELDASQPDSWHQVALQEALNIGTNPEIAKTSVQWASANNRPDIVRMIIEKADTRARDADLHRHQYPELDYWARRARDDASALREANTGAWAEPNTTPLEAIALGRMPQDMLGFIRDRGGIRDTEGELKAIGARDKTGIINNTSGLHPDEMRRILVEQGYLDDVPHDQQTQSTVNDLYDAVGDALNGRKIYRATDADRADMINRTKVKSSEDEKAEAAIIMQLKKWHRDYEQPYKMTEGDEADIVRRVMDGHDLDTVINDQARDWYNEVYQGIDSRRAPPRGETPISRGESRDGFEAESRAVEPGTDGAVPGGESGDWWREQNPWSIGRQAPTLDGASRVQDAISRAMHRLPDGVTAQNVRDVGDVRGSVGDRAAEWQRKTGRNVDGTYNRDTGDIYIAHHALNPDAVVGHELFHALRERGLISDDDLHIMAHAAEQIPDLWNKSVYEKAYDRANNKSELMAEEAGAHLYQKRIEGYDFGPRVNSILDRIKAFIDRVRNALRGDGFNTSEQVQRAWDEGQDRAASRAVGLRGRTAKDIMDEIDSGHMAQRDQRSDDRTAPNRELDDSLNQNSQSNSPNLMYSMGAQRDLDMSHEAKMARAKEAGWLHPKDGRPNTPWVPEQLYHQTHVDNVPSILKDGFDISRVGARGTDEGMPDGVFLKPWDNDIGVGGRGKDAAQMALWAKIQQPHFFKDRNELSAFLRKDPLYDQLADEVTLYDREQSAKFEKLFADKRNARGSSPEEYAAVQAELDKHFADTDAGLRDRAAAARKRATEILTAGGYDALHMQNDVGGTFNNKTVPTTVVFDPKNLRDPNAAFDPDKANSPNLMYSFGGERAKTADHEALVPKSVDTLGYYSHALEVAKSLKQAKGTPEQMLAMMKAAGVKQAEIEATGLDKFLSAGSRDGGSGRSGGAVTDSPQQKATRPEPDGLAPKANAMGVSEVLAETPEFKRIEAAAVKAFERDLNENEHKYFEFDYDENGDRIPNEDRENASLYRSSAFDILPATAEAMMAAASAAGHELHMARAANAGSWYGTLKVKGKPDQKVRLSDHENTSSKFDAPDINVSPDGGFNPSQFIERMVELNQQAQPNGDRSGVNSATDKRLNQVTRDEIASYLEKNRVAQIQK